MTGHEEGSHKKRIKTRLQDTDEKRKQKKLRISEPPTSNTAPPVVTQTQDDVPAWSSPANLLANTPPPVISQTQDKNAPASPSFTNSPAADVVSTGVAVPESPTADHNAITEMNTGGADETTEGATCATGCLVLFKERVSKKNAAKLTNVTVFNHVRQGFIKASLEDLVQGRRPVANSSQSARKAVNSFDTLTYVRQTKVELGKSRRIAEMKVRNVASVTPEPRREVDTPIFDIKSATKLAPGRDWDSLTPNFSLDSRKLRRYVVEDVMFADPTVHERLLLLVSVQHPAFHATWLPIYTEQGAMRAPIMLDKVMYFQIESEVIKNSKRGDYVDGLVSEDNLKYQLSYKGGAGVRLQFPSCLPTRDMELKFAAVLFEADTFHVWGTRKLGREFHQKFHRIKNDQNREALFSRYLLELCGDATQTMYLAANYKNHEKDATVALNAKPDEPITAEFEDSVDLFPSLVVGGDIYKSFVQHVDGVFRQSVVDCYGCFVSMTA